MKPFRLTFLLICLASGADANAPSCETLTAQATERHGLPKGLLTAIAHTESGRAQGGRGLRAWPWTSNVRGQGYYYKSKAEALRHLKDLAAQGVRGFDVGCMQLNYRWHGERFENLGRMIDPASNVDYAARYLKELHRETGSWDHATRYYHSRDAERGAAYLDRVRRAHARIDPSAKPEGQPVMAAQSAPPEQSDRRFLGRAPLIRVATQDQYWKNPALPEGALPILPKAGSVRAYPIKR